MLISDIMARSLEFIEPGATIQEAAELMGELDVGALPVGSPQDLQGILSDRDILFRVVAEGRDPAVVKVREAMSTNLFSIRPGDSLDSALEMMAAYHVRRLPVVEDGAVLGWVTLSDISRRLLLETGAVQEALGQLTALGVRE